MNKISSTAVFGGSIIAVLLGLTLSGTVSAATINQYGQLVYQGGELMPNLSGGVTYSVPFVTSSSAIRSITHDLVQGNRGAEVNILQNFLVGQNKGPAARTLGAHGTTFYFGNLTRAALAEFQLAVGIAMPLGNFDATTRSHISAGQY